VTDGVSSLSGRRYRRLDVLTKLGGLAAMATALEIGIASTAGLALAGAGLVLGVSTVFVTKSQ
jgi:hypothetical protein